MFDFDELEVAVPYSHGKDTNASPDVDLQVPSEKETGSLQDGPGRTSPPSPRKLLAAGKAAESEEMAAELLKAATGVQAYKLKKVRLRAMLHPNFRPRAGTSPAPAVALARSLAEEQPGDSSSAALLGRALRLQGDRAAADALWKRAAAQEGPDGEVRALLRSLAAAEEEKKRGNTDFKDSKWEAACAAYTRALEFDALCVDRDLVAAVLGNRSAAQRKLGLFEEALSDAEESLHFSAGYAKARFRRALALMQFERYSEALADLRLVRSSEPSTPGLDSWILRAEHWANSSNKNHYVALGVPMDAAQEEIKKAHKRMALKWHPDKVQAGSSAASPEECEERFKAIQVAFEFLSSRDDHQRDLYDFGRIMPREPQKPHPPPAAGAAKTFKEPMPRQLVKMGFGTVRKGDGITTCMCCGETCPTYWDKKQHINVTDHPGFFDEKAKAK